MQKKILQLFWRSTASYRVSRNLSILFPILAVITNVVAGPYVLSLFINRLQGGNVTVQNSLSLIVLYIAIMFVGEVVLWRFALYFTWTFQVNAQRDLYVSIFEKLTKENLNFHANRFGGSLVSQTTKLVGSFERFWDMVIWSITPMITTVVGSIAALTYLGMWMYALFIAVYAAAFIILVLIGSRFLTERNKKEAAASTQMSGYLADIVTNVSTVKAFGREGYEYLQAKRVATKWRDASFRLKWGVIWATAAFSSMYAFSAGATFAFAAYSAEHRLASIGMIYLMFIFTLNINRQLWEMNNITRTYSRVIGDAYDMTEILGIKFALVDKTTDSLVAKRGDITFINVNFAHDNGDGEHVFHKFNLTIPAGQRVGVVGHSGSGKTTLTRILLRFSDIDGGEICIDDQNISMVTQKSLHEAIAYVSQEPLLFHRSLAENISYGRSDATHDDIVSAAKKAHAYEFIAKLPNRFETTVGERGVKLSGGQRQRIAIARAILKDAPILVLDEATSALDSESEKLIQASLDDLMKGRTSIVIAHRLSTIAKLDRIIVLDNGKIVEDGTHTELLKQNGTYAKLWSHQSGGFIEE